MNRWPVSLYRIISSVVCSVLFILATNAPAMAELALFRSVVEQVEKQYVEAPDFQVMLRGALRGLDEEGAPSAVSTAKELQQAVSNAIARKAARSSETEQALEVTATRQLLTTLDPYSALLSPDDYQELMLSSKGTFSGIGAEIRASQSGIEVVSPLEGSPAFEAGIRAGDVIESIDNTPTAGMNMLQAVKLLRGASGSRVALQVRNRDGRRTVTLVRRSLTIKSVSSHSLGNGVGYLKISQFQEHTPQLVEDALYQLEKQGIQKGLVLDLRNNPGGLLDAALKVTDMFVDTGTLLVVKGRTFGDKTYSGKTMGTRFVANLVILVNHGSASAAEILAGSLHDRRSALLVGEKSFGKGSVQTIIPLQNGYAVKLTTAHYYLPSGQMVQAGITPDVAIKEQEGRDQALAYAQMALQTGLLAKDQQREVLALLAPTTGEPVGPVAAGSSAEAPVITITAPLVQRGLASRVKGDTLRVAGAARSSRGIARVTVNGQPAALDEEGNFSAELLLRPGENEISVQALALDRRTAGETFRIVREIGRPVVQASVPPEGQHQANGPGSGVYHALLIAVQDYRSSEILKLDHPVTDATQLMQVLTTRYTFDPAHVILLKNPDRRMIFHAFESLRKNVGPRDSLLVFFAGHGVWRDDMQQGFWLPRDAAGMQDPSDWISNSTLRDYIKAIKARHVLLVADACFSGGIFKVRDAFSRPSGALEKIFEMPSRKAITSGSLKTVPDRSVFVEYLVKRLKENRDHYLDAQRLYTSFREAVINNSPVGQTPLYGAIAETGDEGGDFVFIRRR